MITNPSLKLLRLAVTVLAMSLWGPTLNCLGQNQTSAPPAMAQQVGAAATEVTQTTITNAELLWKRIDEKRLKNRTPDEIVAWALMGLLVGGMLYRFSKMSQLATVLVGLAGAFIGGIVANVLQLDLGLGPVLIRYEELICSLLGGLALFFAWRWFTSRSAPKPAVKAPAK